MISRQHNGEHAEEHTGDDTASNQLAQRERTRLNGDSNQSDTARQENGLPPTETVAQNSA